MSEEKGNARQFLLIAVGVIVAVGIGKVVGSFPGESATRKVKQDSPAAVLIADQIAPVIAAITIQATEGTSETDLDLEGLKRLEQHLVQTTLKRIRSNYAKQEINPKTYNPKVDVGSVYMVENGKKIAVIKMSIDDRVRTVWIMGFHRGQFLRVTCIRGSNHEIPIFSGECGQKVAEAFGVSDRPEVR